MSGNRLTPFQGRDPWAGQLVAVYRNLAKAVWSLKAVDGPHAGRVVAHAARVGVADCHMKINVRAQAKIAAGAHRDVHAFVVGRLTEVTLRNPVRLTYRPHQQPVFFLADTGTPVWTAAAVLFTDAAWIEAPSPGDVG
ncbi:hypothetical protein MCEMIE22_03177 [Mycobacteriaceae bacterium]